MIWSVIQVFGKQSIIGLTVFVLAFYLDAVDFGLVGMALAWIMFIQTFSEIGFGAALIQRQNLSAPERYFSTLFYLNVGLGVLLTFCGVLASWPCALFFKTPAVQPVMAALSIGFLINSLTITQVTVAQKEMRFRDLAKRDISAASVSGVIGIVLARQGFGSWSIVIQSLSNSLIAAVLLWKMTHWKPRVREFSGAYLRELWPYSSQIFVFNIVKYFAQNIDKLIIGSVMGAAALGYYTFASRIVFTPVNTVLGAIGVYLFPRYSLLQDDLAAIRESYLTLMKGINIVIAPFLVLAALLAPLLVQRIWSEKWLAAVPIIKILCLLAILQTQIAPIGQILKALNRPTWLLLWSVFITVLSASLIALGARMGLAGAALGLCLSYLLGIPVVAWMLSKMLRYDAVQLLSTVTWPIASACVMGFVLWVLLKPQPVGNEIIDLMFKCAMAGIVYLGVLFAFEREVLLLLVTRFTRKALLSKPSV